jgi:hypothetical protein
MTYPTANPINLKEDRFKWESLPGWIAGISAPGDGYLAGVFLAPGGPSGTAPPSLDFTSAGIGTSFTSLSPLLDRVFFIGDGLTGNGTGSQQMFMVPTGATQLVLGIEDECTTPAPGCYSDNLGYYTVGYSVNGAAAVPEPSTLALFGLLGLAEMRVWRSKPAAT